MGEERDDSQRLKKIAAEAYDYENDPRWADYWSNILIPPHMSSSPDVMAHFKQKFYKRFIDSELLVDSMSGSSPSKTTKRASSSSSRSTNDSAGSTGRTSGFAAASPRAGASSSGPPTSLRWDRQTIQFSVNAWVFLVAVLAIIPLVPRFLSNRAYRLSFMGTACSSLYSLYALYGIPRDWTLQGLQVYFRSIVMSKDFIYLIYCLTFVMSHLSLRFALIPILCRALVQVAKFLRRNFSQSSLYRKYLEEACVWVESNTTTLNILSSHVEIGNGFLLIISLFSWQRDLIQTFMYWQLLKLMYHAPVTSDYHLSVWTKIGRTVHPFIHRYTPFLETPLSAVQRWWLRPCATWSLIVLSPFYINGGLFSSPPPPSWFQREPLKNSYTIYNNFSLRWSPRRRASGIPRPWQRSRSSTWRPTVAVQVPHLSSSGGYEPASPRPSRKNSFGRDIGHAAKETYLVTSLSFTLLQYLGVGYRWITRLLALACYAMLLMPGFLQVAYDYYFSSQVRRSIVYGDQPRNRLDLYLPTNTYGNKPVVVFVTGGAWIIGYKAWGSLLGLQLAERNIIVACIDYRNFPQGTISDMVEDASRGISYICNNIADYGGDPDRIYLMGQSAGAHISSCALLEQAIKESKKEEIISWSVSQIKAYFGLSGGYNLFNLVDHFDNRGLYRSIFLSIMEGEESLHQFSPEVRIQDPSNIDGVSILPPITLFHGTDDYSIPSDASKVFVDVLQRLGAKADLVLYEGKTHTDLFLQDPLRGGKDALFDQLVAVIHADVPEALEQNAVAPPRKRLVPEILLKLAGNISPF